MVLKEAKEMKKSLLNCPVCSEKLHIREYGCANCGTKISGMFEMQSSIGELNATQMELLRAFIASYGNIGEVARILGISRPTARVRIRELGEAIGIPMQYSGESPSGVLDALEKGEISVDEAIERMRGK